MNVISTLEATKLTDKDRKRASDYMNFCDSTSGRTSVQWTKIFALPHDNSKPTGPMPMHDQDLVADSYESSIGYMWTGAETFTFPDSVATPQSDETTRESHARQTIDNLLHGRLGRQTVSDLGTAVDRAKANSAVGKALGGISR